MANKHRNYRESLGSTAALIGVLLLVPESAADERLLLDERLLDERWEEPGFGLSLHPPRAAAQIEHTSDGALARFMAGDEFDFSVFIQESPVSGSVKEIKGRAYEQFSFAYPSASALVDESFDPDLVVDPSLSQATKSQAARGSAARGWKLYLAVPDGARADWVRGHAFIQIDPTTYAVLQFECALENYDHVRDIFEAMLGTVTLASHEELGKRNAKWIEAGHQWLRSISLMQIRSLVVPERWYRVVNGNRDIGWVRVQHSETTILDTPGIYVQIKSHIQDRTDRVDRDSDYFESNDGLMEIWSVRTTRRLAASGAEAYGEAPPVESWAETGLLSDGVLTVSIESAAGVRENKWPMPEKGYLSQVKAHLLAPLLPRDTSQVLAFYVYDSLSETLALRTEQITPLQNGAYLVQQRPSAEAGLRRSTYDAKGQLLRREMADGVTLLRVNREQLKRLHGLR